MIFDIFSVEWLTNNLNSNEFLIAGIFGALAYFVRSVPYKIYNFLKKAFTIEFVITNEDSLYHDILDYIEDIHIAWLNRSYSKANTYDEEEFYPSKVDKKKLSLTVGYGKSYFWYKNRLCSVLRTFKESNGTRQLKEEIKIVMFTRNKSILMDLISSVTSAVNSVDYVQVWTTSQYGEWRKEVKKKKRDLESIYIDDVVKNGIISRVDSFLEDREDYYEKGIPYKLGLMISGKPGTGKTSLIRAIASKYSRDIYIINNNALTETPEIYTIDFDKSILVFEDIDTFSVVKTRGGDSAQTGKMTLSSLLQILDGALTPDGMMVIATTNDINSIDPAILRKGRFDEIVEINELSYSTFVRMCSKLWEVDEGVVKCKIPEDAYKYPVVGSHVQDSFLTNRDFNLVYEELYEKVSSCISPT